MQAEELALRKRLLLQQMKVVNAKATKAAVVLAQKKLAKKQAAYEEAQKAPAKPARKPPREQPKPRQVGSAASLRETAEEERRRAKHFLKRAARSLTRTQSSPTTSQTRQESSSATPATLFPLRYSRGELPCSIEHRNGSQNGLTWVCPLLQLDYEYYLPIFVDGIRSKDEPYKFVARQGAAELIDEAKGHETSCIASCFKEIVNGLRLALRTKEPDNVLAALVVLQQLVMTGYGIGQALVPHFRTLLGVLNFFVTKRPHTRVAQHVVSRDGKHRQPRVVHLTTAIFDTLNLLERTGGPDAFHHIKYMLPTYQSCLTYDNRLPHMPDPSPANYLSHSVSS